VRVEEVVGRRIREAREARGLSQEQFGQDVAALLGRAWPRQAVSAAETGRRSFTAAELLTFSVIIGCDVDDLFRLPGDVESVDLPGEVLTRDRLSRAGTSEQAGAPALAKALSELMRSADHVAEVGAGIRQSALNAQEELDRLLTDIGPPAHE